MPFSYAISPVERVTYVTARGPIDLRSAMEMMGNVQKDPAFSPDFGVVIDASDMEYTPTIGELGLMGWALRHEKQIYRSRVAVIRRDAEQSARRKIYSRLARVTGMAFGLFCDRDEARRWAAAH